LSAGRITSRLAAMTTAMTAAPFAAALQPPAACAPEPASTGSNASRGMTATRTE
jgi:hypothetical protein